MTTMYVSYSGADGSRFDREYYVQHHMRLVMECWGPLGLESCLAFWPADGGAGTLAIAACRFRDEAAMRAALASSETSRVMMADVRRFTDAKPTQTVASPL